jgi:hypothetical protein
MLSECSSFTLLFLHQEGWERVGHGTGTGFSSLTGFWIPDKPPPPPPPKEPKQGYKGGHGSGTAKLRTHAAFAGGKRASSRPSAKKPRLGGHFSEGRDRDSTPPSVRDSFPSWSRRMS